MLTTNYIESFFHIKEPLNVVIKIQRMSMIAERYFLYERYVLQNAIQYCIISSKEGD